MPVRRFAFYFFGISVCSTIAFATCAMGGPAPQDAAAPPPDPQVVQSAAPRVPPAHKAVLVATAG